MPLPEIISRLRKQHHVTQEPLSDALFSLSGVIRLSSPINRMRPFYRGATGL